MKYTIVILLLGLFGCTETRKFQIGDCVAYTYDKESWEDKTQFIEKIMDIGKKRYHTAFYYKDSFRYSGGTLDHIDFVFEDYYEKVPCPKGGKKK